MVFKRRIKRYLRHLKKKWPIIRNYLLDRMGEASTWQGIGFVVALTGCKVGLGLDWGQAAGLGGAISAAIKMSFPDNKKHKDS